MSAEASPPTTPSATLASPDGVLTPDFISHLRTSFRIDEADRARQNAITQNEINSLALNHSAIAGADRHFSHRVRTKGITNQKQSGRCWMFAALNTVRPHVIRENGMEQFEFSVAYLQFWDKLERANLFFEELIELRDADYLDREWEIINRWVLEDGGWWNFLVALVEKYGVMPREAMPETKSSSDTKTLNKVLRRLVQSRAARMLERHAGGAPLDQLREMKQEALAEVYRVLVICFGEPPEEFAWRFKRKNKSTEESADGMRQVEDPDLSAAEVFTPTAFYQRFVGRPLSEFVCLYHDPKNELHRHYVFARARNMVGTGSMGFINVGPDILKQTAIRSILANEPLWFAVNMDIDQSNKHGVMQHRLFDYEALFGVDLSLDKAARARFHAGVSNHAMALIGVDLDQDGTPRKWLVENSWGDDKGDDGRWILHDPWFDEHVYTLIVHRRHVAAEILARFEDDPVTLPAWYPGAAGVA